MAGAATPATRHPTFGEHQVVDVFEPDTSHFLEDIERLHHLLKVDEPNLPGALLLLDHGFERGGGAAVSASGVKEHEVDDWLL